MISRIFALSLLSSLLLLGWVPLSAQYPTIDSVGFVRDAKGCVYRLSGQSDEFVIRLDTAEQIRYYPVNLDSTYKVHELKIIFSGKVGKVPPHARMIGTPLEITSIRKRKKGR